MPVINTNVSAFIAQNAMTVNSRAQSSAMQQLSTGLRINGAKDDAAGLAISSKMTSQIRGLDQSVRNANDAISLLQTADGAISAVSDMLQRMRELSVQAASDTNVSADRTALNNEFQQLTTEIGRVGTATEWNGMKLLNGTGGTGGTGNFTFQIGANNSTEQRITQAIASIAAPATTAALTVTNTQSLATAASVQTSTFSTAGAASGDTYNLSIGGTKYSYTVTAADMAATTPANTIATNMAASLAAQGLTGVTASGATSATLTLTGGAGAAFSVSGSRDSAGLNLVSGSILTQSTAQAAITSTDAAITTINASRASIGATINRLTYAADNLSNISQNTTASRSRILDTDYAKASTELSRTQIISQAATAMLAQANQSQQSVLALLK